METGAVGVIRAKKKGGKKKTRRAICIPVSDRGRRNGRGEGRESGDSGAIAARGGEIRLEWKKTDDVSGRRRNQIGDFAPRYLRPPPSPSRPALTDCSFMER